MKNLRRSQNMMHKLLRLSAIKLIIVQETLARIKLQNKDIPEEKMAVIKTEIEDEVNCYNLTEFAENPLKVKWLSSQILEDMAKQRNEE